jgi:hypothetical protein
MMLQPRSARRTPRALATFAEKIPHLVMNHPGDDLFHSARTKLDRAGIRCVSCYSATIKDGEELENALRFANIPEVMRELHRRNFAHLIAIECEKEGDVNRDMKADVEFARKCA